MKRTTDVEVEPTPLATSVAAPPSKLRHLLTVSWVVTIVLFTVARFFVAKETLEGYGLNIWIFGFIDLVTAVPYALGVARVVGAMIDRDPRGASGWGIVACASFLAPYVYIAWAGQDASFPPMVYVALVALMAIFGANAIVSVRRKVRDGRTEPIATPAS